MFGANFLRVKNLFRNNGEVLKESANALHPAHEPEIIEAKYY